MTTVSRSTLLAVLCVVVSAASAPAQDRTLTLADVSSDLARLIGNTDLDFVRAANIQYGITGKSDYDRFYRESAVAYGGLVVGQGLADDATMNLKNYARSKMAVAELESEIEEITGGADPEEWTTAESFAVLRAAQAKDQLSGEERDYMIGTAAQLAATLPMLKAAIESAAELTGLVPGLVRGARSAFGLRGAAGAARNVRRSADRIKELPGEAAGLVEALTVLSQGLSMVSGG